MRATIITMAASPGHGNAALTSSGYNIDILPTFVQEKQCWLLEMSSTVSYNVGQ